MKRCQSKALNKHQHGRIHNNLCFTHVENLGDVFMEESLLELICDVDVDEIKILGGC